MRERPLSPHLGVYRFAYTMATSIFHRITGGALSVGLLLLVYWLMAAADGPEAYDSAMDVLMSGFGKLVIAGFVIAFASIPNEWVVGTVRMSRPLGRRTHAGWLNSTHASSAPRYDGRHARAVQSM